MVVANPGEEHKAYLYIVFVSGLPPIESQSCLLYFRNNNHDHARSSMACMSRHALHIGTRLRSYIKEVCIG